MSWTKELYLFSFVTGNDESISTPDGTLNPSKSTKNAKPITPSSEFATDGSTYTPRTPSTVSFTRESSLASHSGNLSHKDYTPVVLIDKLLIYTFAETSIFTSQIV